MTLSCEDLQARLLALHRANLELIKDVSLVTLLQRIAQVAKEQAGAEYAALAVLDEDGGIANFVTVGMTESQIAKMPHKPKGLGLLGALMDTEDPIRLPVLGDDARSVGFPAHHPPMRSFLGVPILTANHQLGQIYLTNKKGAVAFDEDDEQIIQMLAGYAAAAIQNARLYGNLRERDIALTQRSEDLALLNDIAAALVPNLGMDEIVNKTLALVMDYLHVEAGEIFLLDDETQTLRLVLHRGEAAEAFWTRSRFKMGEGFVGLTALQNKTLVSEDLSKDMRYLRSAVLKAGFQQFVCLPLTSGEKMIGVLGTAKRGDEPFDDRSLQLLSAVGNWAGLAIENSRLHTDARRLAVLEERERIGMDMHDGVIQSIFGVGLSLENVRHLLDEDPQRAKEGISQAIDGLNQSIRDLRTYILDLRPRQLGEENLLVGLRRLLTEYRVNTLSEAMLTGKEEDFMHLPQNQALIFFHICQEALANTAKHARAKRVSVNAWTTRDRVLLEIEDNGNGFALDKMSMTLGHGLSNMHTRLRNAGGKVEIISAPDEGTTVLAWLPREEEDES
ncbi:MAG: GAF domain-containing sensor histidine kinase [Anaerolineae bacterium]|jgi:two-component system, NarL family, sensor histidine kinase DevS|nr:GAF domain-containing sensor histidine kinase [Anaerolineae bacterium]MBT7071345.1 GAF domain-containing sensor histidine kinase [Anaerolineae bacterium]MBT7324147.1 GAF domain-containing sensor histidine kinase [Anaerolineae bacterium]